MSKAIVMDKRFARVEIRCQSNEIVCYADANGPGISLAEYMGYVIDTLRGQGRCSNGQCALEGFHLLIKVERTVGPAATAMV